MAPEPTSFNKSTSFSSNQSSEGETQKRVDGEVRDMISKLTQRLTDLHAVNKPHGSSQWGGKDEEGGIRIITLAGSNTGATMRADVREILDPNGGMLTSAGGDREAMGAYTNSNFQAVNNAILLDGSCTANDPGIHLVISDYLEDRERDLDGHEKKKKKDKSDDKHHRQMGSDGEA